jgi:hypothetical protein
MKAAGHPTRRNKERWNRARSARNRLSHKAKLVLEDLQREIKAGHSIPPKYREYVERLISNDLRNSPSNNVINSLLRGFNHK